MNWDEFFAALRAVDFDETLVACVFAREDSARSSIFMREKIAEHGAKH